VATTPPETPITKGKPQYLTFFQGMGSILDLGAVGGEPKETGAFFPGNTPEQTIREAWQEVLGCFLAIESIQARESAGPIQTFRASPAGEDVGIPFQGWS